MEPHRPGEDADDNPQLNMTPMIDVVFQLMIVFLCSMKFRTLDMKIDAHLPDEGMANVVTNLPLDRQLKVRLVTTRGTGETRVVVAGQRLGTTDGTGRVWVALEQQLRSIRARDAELTGEIDAGPEVPHGDVMHALDAFLGAEMDEVKFRGTAGP